MSRKRASALLCGALFWLACSATAASIELPARVDQGALVPGRVPVGSRVWLDGRELRVSSQGHVVFGIARDARSDARLEVTLPDGRQEVRIVRVLRRDWPVEHVRGVPPATVDPPPEIAARIAREQAAVAAARDRDDARTDFAAGFAWPLQARISGRFGSSRSYNGKPGSPHSGMDLAAPSGTTVRAPAAGIVSFAAPDLYLTGGTVLLDHGHGISSVFLHLSRIDVEVGERLERGDPLGAVGATGRASGPHLHWGLNWFGTRLDPQSALSPQ